MLGRLNSLVSRRPRGNSVTFSFSTIARDFERTSIVDGNDEGSTTAVPFLEPGSPPPLVKQTSTRAGSAHAAPDQEVGSALSLELNRKIRRTLLTQNYITNRFVGSAAAEQAERAYHAYVNEYQLFTVMRRITVFALLLPIVSCGDLIFQAPGLAFMMLRTVLPVLIILVAAAACVFVASARRRWRMVVMVAVVAAFNSIIWAEATLPAWLDQSGRTDNAQYAHHASYHHLIWLLWVMMASTLLLALDFVQVAAVLMLQICSYWAVTIFLFARWWVDTHQGRWGFSRAIDLLHDDQHSSLRELVNSLWWSFAFLMQLLVAARRLNRTERMSFVNSHVLLSKVTTPPSPPPLRLLGRLLLCPPLGPPRVRRAARAARRARRR